MKKKYKLTIQYEGTDYSGWQVQPDATTIQETIEQVLEKFLQEPQRIIGAGRTDSGVHALGQVAHFTTERELDQRIFLKSANGLLPHEIRITHIEEVPESFHAQKSAKKKIYHYHLYLDPVQSPFKRRTTTLVRKKIDLELLKKAASEFVGTHDFTSFANSAHEGAASKSAVRTIYRLDVVPEEGGIRLEFEGSGFLYKMVRNITGMLIDVSSGRRPLSDIQKVLAAKDRREASRAAPATGLFLVEIFY